MRRNALISIGILSMTIVACGGGGGIKSGGGGAKGGSSSAGMAGTSAGSGGTAGTGSGGTAGTSGRGGTAGRSGSGGAAGTSGSGGSSAGDGETCMAVAACGGDIEGTWEITSSCMIGDITAILAKSMSELPAACNDLFQNYTFSMAGTMTFANGTLTNNVNSTARGREHLSPACMSALEGMAVSSVSAETCSSLEDALFDSNPSSSGICTVRAVSCDCDFTMISYGAGEKRAYVLSGNQVVDPTGEDDPMDYCVSGTTLTLLQRPSGASELRMALTLRRMVAP